MNRIPVECTAVMSHKEITPLKVRYEVNDERVRIKVDRILVRDKKIAMPNMNQPRSVDHIFKCETVQGDFRKPFTLTFNDQTCRWYIYVN